MSLSVSVQEQGPTTTTISLTGQLDRNTVTQLDPELDEALAAPIAVLVFDLAGLDYIASAGLRSLFKAQKSMRARDGRTLFVNVQPPVRKVFDIVRAVDVKTIFRSVQELDDYLDAMQRKVVEDEH